MSRKEMQEVMQDVSMSFAAVAEGVMEQQQSSKFGRSVVDFDNAEDLRRALEDRTHYIGEPCEFPPEGKSDWLLPVPDPEAEPQSVQNELQRLLTLKSYLLLDAQREEAFEKLTNEARELFNVPASFISLIDLGRQFLFSGAAQDQRETSRTSAFCSHTILSKTGICVVPDTFQDARFRNNNLVTGGPKLRFYAGAPLISPEGYKLGTFCVEGPEPRPQGLSLEQREKLKEFAAKAMELMVQRRKAMARSYNAVNLPENKELRRHASVTTNLGAEIYKHRLSECITAMRLFQESVQTLMHLEESAEVQLGSKERQIIMSSLLGQMIVAETQEQKDIIIKQVKDMFPDDGMMSHQHNHNFINNNIPAIFSLTSKLRGTHVQRQGLIFNEAFEIHLEPSKDSDQLSHLDDRAFIIPLEQCSKATLFNMGLIHYHWGSEDSAMQFFDLAASLSQQQNPTHFDPVILGCLNNMAQIHLQQGRSQDAMDLMADALTRGNAALTSMYSSSNSDTMVDDDYEVDEAAAIRKAQGDVKRTRRLRRKLARTVMNIGHVHFFQCDYDAALNTCIDALKLLHTDMQEPEVAAAWYNMALLYYHKREKLTALEYLDRFLNLAGRVLPTGGFCLQVAEGLQRKGKILFEIGDLNSCMVPLNEALKIRQIVLTESHPSVAETLCLIGKVLQEKEQYDFALNALEKGLSVQRQSLARTHAQTGEEQAISFDVAQTLLDIGRAHHALRNLVQALQAYLEVLALAREFFGATHPFVARIGNIIGNLYLETGEPDKSVLYFEEAAKIQVELGMPIDVAVQPPLANVDHDANHGAQMA